MPNSGWSIIWGCDTSRKSVQDVQVWSWFRVISRFHLLSVTLSFLMKPSRKLPLAWRFDLVCVQVCVKKIHIYVSTRHRKQSEDVHCWVWSAKSWGFCPQLPLHWNGRRTVHLPHHVSPRESHEGSLLTWRRSGLAWPRGVKKCAPIMLWFSEEVSCKPLNHDGRKMVQGYFWLICWDSFREPSTVEVASKLKTTAQKWLPKASPGMIQKYPDHLGIYPPVN